MYMIQNYEPNYQFNIFHVPNLQIPEGFLFRACSCNFSYSNYLHLVNIQYENLGSSRVG
jgi:hypothetical protein